MEPSGLTFLKHLDQNRASPASPPSENITLDCLADMDRQANLAQSDNAMGSVSHQLTVTQGSITKRQSNGFDPLPEQLRILRNNQGTLKKMEQKRRILNTMSKKIGDVIATSGKAILGKRIMDWALIRLDEEAQNLSSPNKIFAVTEDQSPSRYGAITDPVPLRFPVARFDSLKKGGWYTKLGRTTGVTSGLCNGALACCN